MPDGADPAGRLGDFTTSARTVTISAFAIAIGLVSACLALGLLVNLDFLFSYKCILIIPVDLQLYAIH